jgi:hypothetical protein
MCGAAVEGQALDPAVCRLQDRAARRLVDAARFHADKAVLDEIEPADPVPAADLVQPRQQRRRGQRLAIHRDRVAVLEGNLDILRRIGRGLGRDGAAVYELLRLDPRVLEDLALGRDVQQVGVDRERRFAAFVFRDRDLVFLGIVEKPGARIEIPFAPRSDDLDVGIERVIAELEANLVVALAGGAVSDGVGADPASYLDLTLGDQRPGDLGAEQIGGFIEGIGAKHRRRRVRRRSTPARPCRAHRAMSFRALWGGGQGKSERMAGISWISWLRRKGERTPIRSGNPTK